MTRTVADAAALLGAMSGADPDDPATTAAAGRGGRATTRELSIRTASRAPASASFATSYFGYSPAVDQLAEAAIAAMKKQGAVIVDPANIPTLGKFDDGEMEVLLFEFKADLNKYLTWLGAASPVHSLKDVIAFNEAHKDQEMPYFGQEVMAMAEKKGPLTSAAYKAALARNHQMARTLGIDATMTKFKLDALIAPTGAPAWLIDLVNGDGGFASAASPSSVAAVAGYPHITVPSGYYRGLPVGISFFGRAWSEPTLIKLAYAYRAGNETPKAAGVRGDREPDAAVIPNSLERSRFCRIASADASCQRVQCGEWDGHHRHRRDGTAVAPASTVTEGHNVNVQPVATLHRPRTGRRRRDHHPRRGSLVRRHGGRRYGMLCQRARPTKNGPSRSRYSDVCCVFRIVCTIADSG